MGELEKKEVLVNELGSLLELAHYETQKHAIQSANHALVARNWLFGYYIVEFEEGAAGRAKTYGKSLLQNLSHKLSQKGIKGVSETNLKLCRQFYLKYPEISSKINQQKISQALSDQSFATKLPLSWSHYTFLIGVKNETERSFYEIEAIQGNWTLTELKRQFNASLYERLALSRDKKGVKNLAKSGQQVNSPADVVKDPYVLEFLGLKEEHRYSETELETAIIDKLEHFLLELGKGFLFEARQKRFSFDDKHFFVDLVFYNRLLRSYVLIDLKIGELKHQDLGQMQMYVNYFDRYIKKDYEGQSIGIVLCHKKSQSLVELTLPKDSNIHASEYQLYLPSKEELQKQLQEAQAELEEVDNA